MMQTSGRDGSTRAREISCALVAVAYAATHQQALRDAFAPAEVIEVDWSDQNAVSAALDHADVAVIPGAIDDRFLAAPHLQWIHCDASGIESSARPEIFARGLIVSGSAGRSAPVLAEHALFLTLSLIYDSPALMLAQQEHRWRGIAGYSDRRGLYGKTIGIVGLGATGMAVARLAKALHMRVLGYRRSDQPVPADVDHVYSVERGERLTPLLKESDVVVLATRLSNETRLLVRDEELAAMKSTAYLVNVARGAVVDEGALVRALQEGSIAGAGLDVFTSEPLAAESPLWSLPHVIITPHMTPEMPDFQGECLAIIRDNIHRYRMGQPLRNALVPEDVYTLSER